jgi:hypothetical protein
VSKGSLEFTLPEEEEEFRLAQQGGAWRDVAWELDQWLRQLVREKLLVKEVKSPGQAWKLVQQRLRDLVEERDLFLY